MLKTKILNLNGTAVELSFDDTVDTKNVLIVQNTATTGYAYIGNSTVTTSNYGYRLHPSQAFTVELEAYDQIYICGDSGVTVAVLVLEKNA